MGKTPIKRNQIVATSPFAKLRDEPVIQPLTRQRGIIKARKYSKNTSELDSVGFNRIRVPTRRQPLGGHILKDQRSRDGRLRCRSTYAREDTYLLGQVLEK